MNKLLRHIAGYTAGITFFFIIMPFALFELSKLDYLNDFTILIHSSVIKTAVSFLLLLTGLLFVFWSNIFLFRVGKGGPADVFGVSVSPRSRKLVTTGPYRYSRNPMVLGAFSTYLSIALYLNSLNALIGIFILMILAVLYLRFSEEKRLLKDFGTEYAEYRKKVPMIFPVRLFTK